LSVLDSAESRSRKPTAHSNRDFDQER
jgi:hypothetical protein